MSKAIPISAVAVAALATILFIVIAATPSYYRAKGDERQSFGAFRSCILVPTVTALSVPHQMHTSGVARKLLQSFPGGFPGGSIPGGSIPGGSIPGGNIPGGSIPGGSIPGGGSFPGGNIPGGTDICRISPSSCSGGVPDPCKINPSACTSAGGGGAGGGSSAGLPAACAGRSIQDCATLCASNPSACGINGGNAGGAADGSSGGLPAACSGRSIQDCATLCASNPSACGMSFPAICTGLTTQQCATACQSNPSACSIIGGGGSTIGGGGNGGSNGDVTVGGSTVGGGGQFGPLPQGYSWTQTCTNVKECKGSGCEKTNALRAFLIIGLLMAAATTGLTIFHLVASPSDIFYYIGAGLATASAISSLICMSIVASETLDGHTLYYGFGFQVGLIVMMLIDAGLIILSAKQKGNKVLSTTSHQMTKL